MARRTRDNFQLGVTVLVMFMLFFAGLLFIGGSEALRRPRAAVRVRFYPAAGMPQIDRGSPVTCFGRNVGTVREARIITAPDPRNLQRLDQQFLEVEADLFEDLGLRQDCSVVAAAPPLGGKGTLEIVSRGLSAVAAGPAQPIYGEAAGLQAALQAINRELDARNPAGLLAAVKSQVDAGDRNSIVTRVHKSLEDINRMTGSLAHELDGVQEDAVLSKVHLALNRLNDSLAEMVELLRHNRPAVNNTVASLDRIMNRVDGEVVSVVAEELDRERGGLLARLHEAFDRLNRSLADINRMTERSRNIVLINADRVDELIQNATQASLLLKSGVRDVVLHPWKILSQPTAAEKRELHVLSVARAFVEAAGYLDDSTSRLKALLDARGGQLDSDDPDLARIRSDLLSAAEKYQQAEQALWRELDAAP